MRYVMVSGSRTWTDRDAIRAAFYGWEGAIAPYSADVADNAVTLIHGAARGADQLAASVAEEMGWGLHEMPALWEVHGRSAGYIRNRSMLDLSPAHVFIFWDGESRGTKHVIDEVQRRRMSYEIHTPKETT